MRAPSSLVGLQPDASKTPFIVSGCASDSRVIFDAEHKESAESMKAGGRLASAY